MNRNRVISTALLFLLLGTTLSAFAQKEQEQKGGGKAQPAQHQAQPQRAQQARQQQPRSVASNRGNNGNHYGRISDDRYRASFGSGHSFRMMRPQMIGGDNRFQYGGYWFGYNQEW